MNDPGMTLEEALCECFRRLPNRPDSRIPLGAGQAETRHKSIRPHAIYLHVAAWTPDEAASIVPHFVSSGSDGDLSAQPAGRNWDYLDGDGMVLVSENHCLITPSGLRATSIERYLRLLLALAREQGVPLLPNIDRFSLTPIANEDVARRIRQDGPKKIHMNIGQYWETARSGQDRERTTLWQRISRDLLLGLVERDEDRAMIEEADNVTAKLTISLDGRRAGLEPSDLAPLAERLEADSEDEDDLVIETRSGERIKRGRLLLSKFVKIQALDKTVSHNAAWQLMWEYYQELSERGALEE